MIIYKVTNLNNGKVYVGQTVRNLKDRKKEHFSDSKNRAKSYFNRALLKYGIEKFKWEVICICPDIDSLNKQEEYYIVYYDLMNTGYNLTSGGLNYLHTEEWKKENGKKWRGKNNPMYNSKRFGNKNPFYMKTHSEEVLLKIKESNKNRKGEKRSEETIKKMQEIAKKRKRGDSGLWIK